MGDLKFGRLDRDCPAVARVLPVAVGHLPGLGQHDETGHQDEQGEAPARGQAASRREPAAWHGVSEVLGGVWGCIHEGMIPHRKIPGISSDAVLQ